MTIGRRARDTLAVLAIALVSAALFVSPAFERGRGLSLDILTWLRFEAFGNRHAPEESPSVVVAIDEESYATPPFSGSPLLTWTGEIGRVLGAVIDGGAKVVGFDIVFPTSIEQSEIPLGDSTLGEKTRGFDREFLRALAAGAAAGKVVLGEVFAEQPIVPSPGQRIAVRRQQNLRPLNTYTDSDDVVRRHPLTVAVDGLRVPSLALELAARARGNSPAIDPDGTVRLGDIGSAGRIANTITLNFAGGADDIPTYSFADLRACAVNGDKDYFRREFAGKVVLIGTVGIEDRRLTSKRFATRAEGARRPRCALAERKTAATFARSTIAGVYIHATAINNLIRHEAAIELGWPSTFALTLAFAVLAAVLARLAKPATAAAALLGLAVLYTGLATALFNHAYVLPLGEPFGAAALALAAIIGYRFMVSDKDRRLLQKSFAYYLAPHLIDRMLVSHKLPQLGGETREITVFFSDIEGFSQIAERMPPASLMALTNEYLSAMTDVIESHGGYVDKYIGDSVVAVFGAPIDDARHATNAARAALACKARLDELNQTSAAFQGIKVAQRIGINSGEALVGNFGSQRRFNYSVMSDAVNVASRLEGANKFYGTVIIASDSTVAAAGAEFAWRELDTVRVKGREQSLTIFELVCFAQELTPEQKRVLADYAAGLGHWRAGQCEEAVECFARSADADRPSALFAERARQAGCEVPCPGWDPVRSLQEK
ncbi:MULTISPECIES: adenylate/guanylate cyclase domain-containing protein [unclassified Bradyrhizobium]|uniref:adenylate/guanylate cyclase domain-containing protein n=1 Tax=unclassified Bradyrhizobium TaxID=2631580 RepID=UPI00291639CE|nr:MULTISPECIES: adenylate/guanylate cyclase domain-containing protein [unclassified Bradyrhizobium]